MESQEELNQKGKKREIKDKNKAEDETQKQEEDKDVQQPSKKKGKKKKGKHQRQETPAKPMTLEQISSRFKDSYLENMNFDSYQPLIDVKGRVKCTKCGTSWKFYWGLWFEPLVENIPKLDLPVNITILKHPGEGMKKSSIIPSKILAPDSVTIYNSLEVPDLDVESTILLFPREDSTPVTSMTKSELSKVKNVVLIDSTWHQVGHFLK